jgi:hypothetical protein
MTVPLSPHGHEQLAEARHGVIGGQEVREDVAAGERAAEYDAVAGRDRGQIGERRRGAHDLEPVARKAFDVARDGHRERQPSGAVALGNEADEEEERLLHRYLRSELVDQVEPLGGLVEDGAEVGAHGRDEPLRLADGLL